MVTKWKKNMPMDLNEVRELLSQLSGKRSRKRVITWALLIIALLSAVGGVAWLIFNRNKNDDEDDYDDYDDYDEFECEDEGCECAEVVEDEIEEIEKEKLSGELEEAMQTELEDGNQNDDNDIK